jgi:ABC-2 type transport system ATP-binding protein
LSPLIWVVRHLPDARGGRTLPGMGTSHTQTNGLAIEVRDLRRSYGEVEAVRGVSFEVTRGEVFCLLGPNGAGKTTTVEILEGYRTRTGGEVRVLGMDPATAGASCASASG